MSDKVFIEENQVYQFDFSKSNWATDKLNDIFHNNNQIWSDVDFIAEYLFGDEEKNIKLLFVEYKNANISAAQNASSFNPQSDKKITNVVRKFTDSLCYMLAIGKNETQNVYVYILEYPNGDSVTRKGIRNRIAQRLPFEFQKLPQFTRTLISKFEVLSIEEWNNHPEYSQFPITQINT